ncbi:MAG: hypothetical protein N2505_04205 [Endomicrobia bacterium]|nr:hypothetical protein [Endomicrobiia bacterium]
MRTALIIILVFLTYSLLYLTSPQKEISAKFYKPTKIKSILGTKKLDKQTSLKVYKINDIKTSLEYNFEQIYTVFIQQLQRYKNIFLVLSVLFLVFSLILTISFNKSKISFIIKIINSFGFSLGENLLIFISLLSVGSWFFLKQNLWQDVGFTIFFIPVAFMLISSINLKIYDFNYPMWSRLFKSFIIPIIVGVIISLRI